MWEGVLKLSVVAQVVRELEKEDLALLVQFFSGTSKVPLEGFKALQVGHGLAHDLIQPRSKGCQALPIRWCYHRTVPLEGLEAACEVHL